MDTQSGGAKKKAVGSRRQVMNGTVAHTVGGLKSGDLKKNGEGKIVSRAASAAGKKAFKHVSGFHALVMKIYKTLPKGSDLSKAMKLASKEWKKKSPKRH